MSDQNRTDPKDEIPMHARAAFAADVKEFFADSFVINDNDNGVRVAFGTGRPDGSQRYDNAIYMPGAVFNELLRIGGEVVLRRAGAASAPSDGQKPN